MPAFFSRGDISPRHATILPLNPLDYPGVQGSLNLAKSLVTTAKTAAATGDLSQAIWTGLEFNGVSRPLAGFARIANGSHTSKGSLISANNDVLSVQTAARLMGARPMDEALALDAEFRVNGFQAANRAKIEELGTMVKRRLQSGDAPTPEELHEFMDNYARAGGNYRSFNAALTRWRNDASQEVTERMKRTLRGDVAKRYFEMLGGEPTLIGESEVTGEPPAD
jgi:hypothetical protein